MKKDVKKLSGIDLYELTCMYARIIEQFNTFLHVSDLMSESVKKQSRQSIMNFALNTIEEKIYFKTNH